VNALALILFLPWFAVIGWVYWQLPREAPRSAARNRIDVIALAVAFALSALGMSIGMRADVSSAHPIWKQVLACLYAYSAYLGVLGFAAWWRSMRRAH